MAHRCNDGCRCPVDGQPLIWSPHWAQHACSDSTCPNAHGMMVELATGISLPI